MLEITKDQALLWALSGRLTVKVDPHTEVRIERVPDDINWVNTTVLINGDDVGTYGEKFGNCRRLEAELKRQVLLALAKIPKPVKFGNLTAAIASFQADDPAVKAMVWCEGTYGVSRGDWRVELTVTRIENGHKYTATFSHKNGSEFTYDPWELRHGTRPLEERVIQAQIFVAEYLMNCLKDLPLQIAKMFRDL